MPAHAARSYAQEYVMKSCLRMTTGQNIRFARELVAEGWPRRPRLERLSVGGMAHSSSVVQTRVMDHHEALTYDLGSDFEVFLEPMEGGVFVKRVAMTTSDMERYYDPSLDTTVLRATEMRRQGEAYEWQRRAASEEKRDVASDQRKEKAPPKKKPVAEPMDQRFSGLDID